MAKNGLGREIPDLQYFSKPSRMSRFKAKLLDSNGCIVWTGTKTTRGYGIWSVYHKKRRYRVHAHRVSWAFDRGRWPSPKSDVHHKCGNPLCCNPAHLCTTSPRANASKKIGASEVDLTEEQEEFLEEIR